MAGLSVAILVCTSHKSISFWGESKHDWEKGEDILTEENIVKAFLMVQPPCTNVMLNTNTLHLKSPIFLQICFESWLQKGSFKQR
jgi:hypothetical protein